MEKRKRIIISLLIALAILIILNCIVINYTNADYIEIPVFKEAMLKGITLQVKDVTFIQVKKAKTNEDLLKVLDIENIIGKVLLQDVSKGEIITEDKFINPDELLQQDTDYQYISIPVNNLSYPTCNKLKRGDGVTVYYTAKSKDVSNAIKDKQRLYSNTEQEGMVTCLLFDMVEVISLHDSTGKETKENMVTDILVRLKKEEAILVANLKAQGTFDIVLN